MTQIETSAGPLSTADGEASTIVSLFSESSTATSLEDIHDPLGPRLSMPIKFEHPEHLQHVSPVHRPEKSGFPSNEVIYVDFTEGDQRNPVNFSRQKKWIITAMACTSALVSSMTASGYNMGLISMTRDLNCSRFETTVALGVYTLGFGIVPLVTASFSEEFGRQPLYIGSAIGFILMYIVIALSQNIQTVILGRFVQGCFGSTGAAMVGGTIADIWTSSERSLPMSIFILMTISGTGLGSVTAGWIEMDPHLEWRWIQWIQMMVCGFYLVLVPLVMRETRSAVLLSRIAKKMRKERGDSRYRARKGDSLKHLIYMSCTRPIHLLLTEPVVLSFSLWIGFAWGITFTMVTSISGVFRSIHGFNTGQVGLIFITMIVGSVFGFITNLYQETLYDKYSKNRGPEARLHTACFAAVLLSIGMFICAWTLFSQAHWIVEMIGITVYIWGTYIVYLAVFLYLADCYGSFASSALAGQNLLRNVAAATVPMFGQHIFDAIGYKWTYTLFGILAFSMIPIPFALFFYGPDIRKRSKFSSEVMQDKSDVQ